MADDAKFYVGPVDSPDKYRLKRQVGSGGEALLWEAEINVSGEWEPVAVKVLRTERFAALDSWKARWAEQAEVLRFVRHPGVVGVREHFEGAGMHYLGEQPTGPGGLYLTMNWVQGPAFRDWTLTHRSPDDRFEALTYLAQVGDVLDWLHSGQATPSGRPIIHADVTPNNVIITPAGQAVLVDFGLTRLAAGLSATIEGTGGYLAPEVKAAGAYSPASDRYAFGALAYFVMTGVAAPAGLPAIRAGLNSLPSVAEQPGSIDHLMQMFDPDPRARPACGEWIRTFKVTGATFVDGAAHAAIPPTMPVAQTTMPASTQASSAAAIVAGAEALTKPRRPRRGRLIVVILASVLALGAGAVVATRSTGGEGTTATLPKTEFIPTVTDATTTTPPTTVAPTTTVTQTTVATTTVPPNTAPRTTIPPPTPSVAVGVMPSCFPNCRGANLNGANLAGLDLSDGDFAGAILTTAILANTNLSGSNLGGANLVGVHGASVNLSSVNLSGADITGANMRGAKLVGSNLRQLRYSYATDLTGADLRNVDLTGGNIQGVVLVSADLSGAVLTGVIYFEQANLSGANLSGTTMPDGSIHS